MLFRYFSIVIFLPALLLGCGGNDSSKMEAPAAPVRVAMVQQQDMERVLQAVGNVRASASVGIVPRVAGEIQSVNFREGQEVREGAPLLQIDPRPYAATLREKKGQLAKSEAQLAKALEDRRRYGKLVNNGYVSREAFEQTATDAAALRATVQTDKAAVESAALDLSYCTVTAPISGRIGPLKVDKGNMVKSNESSPIVNIDTISPCYITFSVPEAQLPAIMRHMEAGPVPIAATPTGGAPERGILTLVDNNVDTKTGTIRLRGTFANENRHLWPGQFVEIQMPLGIASGAIVVPSRAVQAGRDESYVYVVDDSGHAQYHKARVLFESNGMSVLESDLTPGQRVVIDGQVRLAPGLPVKILNEN